MGDVKIIELGLPGVKLLEPVIFPDNRGYSGEMYTKKVYEKAGITDCFVVDYEAYNAKKHTLRGIHAQVSPHMQTKLVRVLSGSILDVVVDLRENSPTYKKWISVELSERNHRQIVIPKGYGHAFLTLEDDTSVIYKFDDYYDGNLVRTVRWNDPELGIEWGVTEPIMSDSDRNAPMLKDSEVDFVESHRDINIKRAIVTGASGFIGRALTKRLLSKGVEVWAVVRSEASMAELSEHKKLHIVAAGFEDYKRLPELISDRNFDAFFHLAWAGYGRATNDPDIQINNILQSCMAAKAAVQLEVKRFLFADSFHEYLVSENAACTRGRCSIYGTAKYSAQQMCRTVAHSSNMDFVGMLFANVYGEGDRSSRSVNTFIRKLQAGQNLELVDGSRLHGWIYIEDCISAILAAAYQGKNEKVYYIGRVPQRFDEVIAELRDVVSPGAELHFGGYQDIAFIDFGDIDVDALRQDTGFQCQTDFAESISRTAEWLKIQDQ